MEEKQGRYIAALRNTMERSGTEKWYSIGGFEDECLCLEQCDGGWIVYYADYGRRVLQKRFADIYAACVNFIDRATPPDKKVPAMDDFLGLLSAAGELPHFGAYGAACAR